MAKFIVALAIIALNYYVYAILASTEVVPPRTTFESFPAQIDEWGCRAFEDMDDEVLARLGASDWVICNYDSPESTVGVYVGYHESQVREYDQDKGGSAIHPPEHCLPGSGWDVIASEVVPIRSGELEGEAKRFVIAKGDSRSLVYFWYQSRGRVVARNHEVILYKFLDRATRNRSDGALVRLTTPIERRDEAGAEARILAFAEALTPLLPEYLPN